MATLAEVLALAWKNQQTGNFSQAEHLYRQVLLADPSQASAHLNLGSTLESQGRLDEAAASYYQALELNPNFTEAYYNLGNAGQNQGRLDQAVACYRQVLLLNPNFVGAHINLGSALQSQGLLDQAVACYRQALRLNPNIAVAHNNLGNALQTQGHSDQAIASYRQALKLNPNYAEAHYNLGNALQSQGQLDEAVAWYRQALLLNPNLAGAHINLGSALQSQGQLDEAVACYRQALRLSPGFTLGHLNLGHALRELGMLDEAVASFQQALRLDPNYAEAHNNLGSVLQSQGRLDEAVASYHQALRLKPNYAEAHNNLGKALQSQGRLDEAVACFRQALILNANFAEAHTNLGGLLHDQGRLDQAAACFRQALLSNANFAGAHTNLGAVLHNQGRLDVAVACYRQALVLNPNFALAHNYLGHALGELGRLDEAVACCRRALQLEPDNPGVLCKLVHQLQQLCLWADLGDLGMQVIAAVGRNAARGSDAVVDPFLFLALPTSTTARQQHQCARQWVEQRLRLVRGPRSEVPSRDTGHRTSDIAHRTSDVGHHRITVGYLSADFHEHPIANLIPELIEKHQRQHFAVFGYSLGPDDGSPIRRRLAKAFDRFVDLKDAAFLAAARRVQADDVDILVDLTGYTGPARTQILALRPAPLQVNYLGYPGTMAAPFVDYILVDDFVVPPEQQPFFTEKLVHLPGCYQVNDSQREIAAHTPSPAECGLPKSGFIFCCFNNNFKITPAMFEVWMRLLNTVPGSVLWLLEDNPVAPVNLRREAEARGVAAERLVFAPRKPLPEHLARHRLANLFLDTFPYNAHTTASDALWAGCPLLTMAGQTFPSRVAGSLLRSIGLPELITTSLQEYEKMALRLAQNADFLNDLRARLQANRKTSRLFDGGQFARSLEQAFVTMWEIYTCGEEPRGFTVPTRD